MIDEQSFRDLKAWAEDVGSQAAEKSQFADGNHLLVIALNKVSAILHDIAIFADYMVDLIQYTETKTQERCRKFEENPTMRCKNCVFYDDGDCSQGEGGPTRADGYCMFFESRQCRNCKDYSDGICRMVRDGAPEKSDHVCVLWKKKDDVKTFAPPKKTCWYCLYYNPKRCICYAQKSMPFIHPNGQCSRWHPVDAEPPQKCCWLCCYYDKDALQCHNRPFSPNEPPDHVCDDFLEIYRKK